MTSTLNYLEIGIVATIQSISGTQSLIARINGLGLRVGQPVTVIRRALMGGPLHVRIGYTDVLMRAEQANLIGLA